MLVAFIPSDGCVVPFSHIARLDCYNMTELMLDTSSGTLRLRFSSQEDRNQQLANFKRWLTIPSNSI